MQLRREHVVILVVVGLVFLLVLCIVLIMRAASKPRQPTTTPTVPPPVNSPVPSISADVVPTKTTKTKTKTKTKKKGKKVTGGGGDDVGTPVSGESGKTNITFFGQSKADDNGEGMAGIDLFGYGKAPPSFQGQRVYPIAVHNKHFGQYMYKVMEINSPDFDAPVLGHVLDMCDENDKVCNTNVRQNSLDFLVDIHATAFDVVGKSDGILTGTYKVVGEIGPRDIPQTAWIKQVQQGKGSFLCSCDTCTDNDKSMKWLELADLDQC